MFFGALGKKQFLTKRLRSFVRLLFWSLLGFQVGAKMDILPLSITICDRFRNYGQNHMVFTVYFALRNLEGPLNPSKIRCAKNIVKMQSKWTSELASAVYSV